MKSSLRSGASLKTPSEAGPITEFPWFTYLFADLHAHAMALPYTIIAIGLALAIVRAEPAHESRLARLARLALLALVLGALWPMNTWDVPTYALLALAALVLSTGVLIGFSMPNGLSSSR